MTTVGVQPNPVEPGHPRLADDARRQPSPATDSSTASAATAAALRRQVEDRLATSASDLRVDWRDLEDPRSARPDHSADRVDGATVAVRLLSGWVVVAATPGHGDAPCPGCLDQRWHATLGEAERHAVDDPHGLLISPAQAGLPILADAVTGLILRAAAAAAVTEGPSWPVWRVNRTQPVIERHALLASGLCRRCGFGDRDRRPVDPKIRIEPTPVGRPGAARAHDVETLGLPVTALANPVCGAIGGPGIRAYHATASAPTSGKFLVRSKYGLHEMWWGGHAESYSRSELVGVLEGLERLAGQVLPSADRVTVARPSEVAGPQVELETCGVYSEAFYRSHAEQYVRWEEDPPIRWLQGWSLRDERAVAVPEQLVYYLDVHDDHRNTVQECSNGCASGTSVTEATLHGLLELLERDAFITSWYAPVTPAEIDLDTVEDPVTQQMRIQLDLLGYDLRCFDIRSDLPVPAVGSVAIRGSTGYGQLCFAGGAGIEPGSAVRAAVCEVASYVPGFDERVERKREFLEAAMQDPNLIAELDQHPLLFGMPQMAEHADHWLSQDESAGVDSLYRDWWRVWQPTDDLADAVRLIVDLLAARDLDVVVVDQTTPEQRLLGIHTVAVVVPGLVPIDFGWQRQRALTMRRTLTAHAAGGRAPRAFRRDELVPYPHPFP